MALDLATAQARLDDYLAAEGAVLKGQAYQLNGRMMRLPDLNIIREGITYWDGWVQKLKQNNGRRGIRIRGATPIG